MIAFLGVCLLLQGGAVASPIPAGETTPAGGDTVGYWQQRVGYTIVATLDEAAGMIHARGDLWYVNQSPDTLHQMFFHQYLNAFRPGSKWSDADQRENRERFQDLANPNFGFERFTAPPTVNGKAVVVDYPGAPDSTVAHITLPAPLAPHDSVLVTFAWDARPSTTVYRRQGHYGRTFDFAQWFPKVAVYDRHGWEPNPLVPAGELYGEFGTYDVTLVVKNDQIVAATGVPVSGDPGWERVSRTGKPRLASDAYADVPAALPVDVPEGGRAVRFYARDVHHFAWSASPDFVYEGGTYIRTAATPEHFKTWDTVQVNVLYKPGDDTTWGGNRALARAEQSLAWLESLYGPYAYPAISVVKRLDRGATEFPMMIEDYTASFGAIDHELGHNFTYGILANNEWRSGWMDEGLTQYQSEWAQKLTPQDHERTMPVVAPGALAPGYRVNAVTIPPGDSAGLAQLRLSLLGRTEPIGTNSADFHEFGIYNDVIYNRASQMYGHLRDLMGDSLFIAFLHDYYSRWGFKHVDEQAMRASAERVSGQNLGWFFDQWLRHTGLLDYAIGTASTEQGADGQWVTHIEVDKRGDYRHPMPVGLHTARGWSIARIHVELDRQILEVKTPDAPDSVRLDPYHVTMDWDRRDDVAVPHVRLTPGWPALNQRDRARTIAAWSPRLWYESRQGVFLGAALQTNYLGFTDIRDEGFAFAQHDNGEKFAGRFNLWFREKNPTLPGFTDPLMGWSGGAAYLDGIAKLDVAKEWDLSPFIFAPSPKITFKAGYSGAYLTDAQLVPGLWDDVNVTEFYARGAFRAIPTPDSSILGARVDFGVGISTRTGGDGSTKPASPSYVRALASVWRNTTLGSTGRFLDVRLVGGFADSTPRQRGIFASSQDPFETFTNDYYRSGDALLQQKDVNFIPLGGFGAHGYAPGVGLSQGIGVNGQLRQRLAEWSDAKGFGDLSLWANGFGDVIVGRADRYSPISFTACGTALCPDYSETLMDAGVGLALAGKLFDRPLTIRLDVPLVVNHPSASHLYGTQGNGSVAFRWEFSFSDLW